MPSIEATDFAVATIFEYPNPFSRSLIEDWATDEGFELVVADPPPFFNEDFDFEGQSTKIGEQGRFSVIYNPEGDLTNFGDCAFVTIVDEQGGQSEDVLEFSSSVQALFDSEGVSDQLAFFEVTLEGTLRVGTDLNLLKIISSEVQEVFSSQYGGGIDCGAVRLTSGEEAIDDGFFKLLIDSEATGNPARWKFKFVRRHSHHSELDKEAMINELRESLETIEDSG